MFNHFPIFEQFNKMHLATFLYIFPLFQTCSARDALPVFLIDSENVMSTLDVQANPFAKMTTTFFSDIIHEAIKRSECVIIFIEDKLCTEDISLRDKYGSLYQNMRKGLLEKRIRYFPSVSEPYKIINQIFPPRQYNELYLDSGVKLQLLDTFKYLYIFFQDGANETRANALRKHDTIINEVYFAIRQLKNGPIVAFYTGKVNPIATEKVEFVPIKPVAVPRDMGVMIVSEGALFRFSGVFAATSARRATMDQMPLVAEQTWTRRKLSTTMAYTEFELQFNFSFEDDNWLLDYVALLEGGEEVGRTEMGVGAPWNWSYVCGEPLSVLNTRDGSAVTISKYQIQPLRPYARREGDSESDGNDSDSNESDGNDSDGNKGGGNKGGGNESGGNEGGGEGQKPGGDSTKCFGKTVNCGPYFNTHILSGLLVMFLFLGITMYGVVMLFNCASNDKYDDPQGKEVFVSTDQH